MSQSPRSFLVALVATVALAGCAGHSPEVVAPTSTSTPVESATSAAPTPEPTVTEAAESSVIPYTGAATCANLLDPATVADFLESDVVSAGDDWSEKIVGELDGDNSGVGLATFTVFGGISCGWGHPYENSTMYGYGPISDEQKTTAIASLERDGYTLEGDRYEKNDAFGSYAFGNGNWAGSFLNGGPDLLDEVIANAPAWSEPEKVDPPSTDPLPTDAATPATAPYLTTEGLDDLRLGSPVTAANALVAWHPDTCFGSWLAKKPYGDYQLDTAAIETIVEDHEKTGTLQFILLRDDTIPTKSGVRVGDSEARLLATYDDLEKVDAEDATVYGVSGNAGRVVFAVAKHDSLIGAYRAGQITAIAAIAFSLSEDLADPSYWAPCTV